MSTLAVCFDAIPGELKPLLQWVAWRYGTQRPNGKRAKPPFMPNGKYAKVDDPTTWSPFQVVRAALLNPFLSFDGIGFMLTTEDGLVAIDLDDCIADDDTIGAWARRIMDTVPTYWERSPSGRGLRAFLEGSLPEGCGNGINRALAGGGRIEVYQCGRYVTVTGAHVPGSATTIKPLQRELEALLVRELPRHSTGGGQMNNDRFSYDSNQSWRLRDYASPHPVDIKSVDDSLLERLRLQLGQAFCALFDRADISAYNGDDSRADLALVNYLVQGCGPDPARVERLFRRSALMRPKWDEYRGAQTYGDRTIAKVIGKRIDSAPVIVLRSLAEVEPENVDWAWQDRIAYGKVSLLAGDPGEGKSWSTDAMCAALTRGKRLPGDWRPPCAPVDVLRASFEDGAADTIRPRADALGTDVNRVILLDGRRDANGIVHPFSLDDVPWLVDALEKYPNVRVLIIDPVSAILANVDSHRDAEIRSKLATLAAFAERQRIAVILVAHLNKNETTKAVYRVGGSIGFVGLSRSVLLFGREPESGRRVIVPLKNNLAALAAAVEYSIENGVFSWGGVVPGVTAAKVCGVPRRGIGESRGVTLEARVERVVRLVQEWSEDERPTQQAIVDAIGGNRNHVLDALARACERRPPALRRHGAGVRGRPFWYEGA